MRDSRAVVQESQISTVSVNLAAANPKQFQKFVEPTNGCSFGDVCAFVTTLADAGVEVLGSSHLVLGSFC